MDLVSLDVEDISSLAPRVASAIPANNAANVGPVINISVTLRDNVTAVNTSSIRLYFDNNLVTPTIQSAPPDTTVTYAAGLLPALSAHTYAIVFSDNGTPATTQSNLFQFTVANYMTLPTTQRSARHRRHVEARVQREGLPGGRIDRCQWRNLRSRRVSSYRNPRWRDCSAQTWPIFPWLSEQPL